MRSAPFKTTFIQAMVLLLAAFNIITTASWFTTKYPKRRPIALDFSGHRFTGLQKLIPHAKYAGYYTDLPANNDRTTMELLQAQHELVPLILDPENIDHRYVIVNCRDIAKAIEKFKALGARPMTRNNAGIFLVERPDQP